jgi:hypothetical protein
VRVFGVGFGPRLAVSVGGLCPTLALAVENDGASVVDARTPAHAEGVVDVVVQNLDAEGSPVPGEIATLAAGYRFLRPRLVREAELTRLVRQLLRELKRQVIANVSLTTSVDYGDGKATGKAIVMATLPALVVTGPRLRENRTYATNEAAAEPVLTSNGVELRRRRPAYTADVEFDLTGSSEGTVELLNLMAAVASFLNRNKWIQMARDPEMPEAGDVRWELDALGDFQLALDRTGDGVQAFACGLVVRGFDVDVGLPMDANKPLESPHLDTDRLQPGGED